jgi:uncharacterized protein (DUF1697 family)
MPSAWSLIGDNVQQSRTVFPSRNEQPAAIWENSNVATPARKANRGSAATSYVALLRGVNVGGHGRVPMKELRDLFESIGLEDVRTLIQSGNVIFRADKKPAAITLQEAIAKRFQVTTPVVLRTSSEFAEIIRNVPFADADPAFLHVGFLVTALSAPELAALEVAQFAPERFAASGTEVYLYLPRGMGNSKLASFVTRKLDRSMTIRNWKTVNALAELSAA